LDEVGKNPRGQQKTASQEKDETGKDARIKPSKQERGKAKSSKEKKKSGAQPEARVVTNVQRPQWRDQACNQTAKRKQELAKWCRKRADHQDIQRCESEQHDQRFSPPTWVRELPPLTGKGAMPLNSVMNVNGQEERRRKKGWEQNRVHW
jgi:hypothetical protein